MEPKFISEKCPHCGQSMTYVLPIDRGTVDILKSFATAIRKKGINIIHPRNEMEVSGINLSYADMVGQGRLTSNQVGNLSRPRFHGLIAKIKGNPGNYCLTTKGGRFLRGFPVPKYAIVSKSENRQIGYWLPEMQVQVGDFRPTDTDYWEGIDFNIVAGRIVKGLPEEAPFDDEKIDPPKTEKDQIFYVEGREIYRIAGGKVIYPRNK